MKCPKCDELLRLSHEKLRETNLENMMVITTCDYFCPRCQHTFLGINAYDLHWSGSNLIESKKENV